MEGKGRWSSPRFPNTPPEAKVAYANAATYRVTPDPSTSEPSPAESTEPTETDETSETTEPTDIPPVGTSTELPTEG